MIGFARSGEKPTELGPYEYRTVRRARFVQLGIKSDDRVLALIIAMFIIGVLTGELLCRVQ